MDKAAEWRVRCRHALRCAVGGASIAAIGLATHWTSGCIPSALFFVSTIAGTPENYQGFQLRSSSLTLIGGVVGAVFYLIVSAVASHSAIGTFFLAIPFIAFLSALRADKTLMPMPPVANVILGFLLISRFEDSRKDLLKNFGVFLLEAAIAWAVAIAVNLVFPDRAGDVGRHMMAVELRRLGAMISNAGTRAFSKPSMAGKQVEKLAEYNNSTNEQSRTHFSIFLGDGGSEQKLRTGVAADDYVFLTSNLPQFRLRQDAMFLHREELVRAAERSLTFIHDLRPFGRTRVSDYATLARSDQLFEASRYEPRILPESASRWRNASAWKDVIANVRELVNKVSSLESVVGMRPGSPARFSEELIIRFFGEAFLPLWVSHFAACAAACGKMSTVMCKATCKEMFHIPEMDAYGQRDVEAAGRPYDLDATIDPRKWKARRSDMYFGFLLRYRLGLYEYCRDNRQDNGDRNAETVPRSGQAADVEGSDATPEVRVSSEVESSIELMRHSISVADLKAFRRRMEYEPSQLHATHSRQIQTKLSEKQALSYFAITSHALSEEIGHVQQSMTALALSSDARGPLAPFYFLISGLPELWTRIKKIAARDVSSWEVRFALTHTMLLSSILGLALFLPLRELDDFEASELAWVFTSAALAAQLSAEPTLFIGTVRVVATVLGAFVAFGFNSLLDAMGRSSTPNLQYLTVPYIFITTICSLLLIPTSFRYASFLFALTNAIMLFCPRASPLCTKVLEPQRPACFPDWQYAVSRSANVSIGVLFAVFFHLMFWPRFANQAAVWQLSEAFLNASRLFGKLHRTYFSYGIGASSDSINRTKDTFEENRASGLVTTTNSFRGDLYVKEKKMAKEIEDKVGMPLACAMLIVKSEADLWRRGPFRLYPLIPHVLSDFVALNVSLGEMAAVLGRRPIFAASYGRSVFEHYIQPMIHVYETIHISLLNLCGTTCRALPETRSEEIKQNVFDLHQAILHLAQVRERLRQDAEGRALEFKKLSAMALTHSQQIGNVSHMKSAHDSYSQLDLSGAGQTMRRPKRKLVRSRSETDKLGDGMRTESANLCVDDVVLYNAFTFITDGCLSAFVRIAATVVVEAEFQLGEMSKAKKRERGNANKTK